MVLITLSVGYKTVRAHTTNWKVLADDATSTILPVEFGQVTLPLIESTTQ